MRAKLGPFVTVLFVALLVIAAAPAAAGEAPVSATTQAAVAPSGGAASLAATCGLRSTGVAVALDLLLGLEPSLAMSTVPSPFQSRQPALGQPPFRLASCSGDNCGCSEGLAECRATCVAICGGDLTCRSNCNRECNEEVIHCSVCCCCEPGYCPPYCY